MKRILPFLILTFISLAFFYKTILFGLLPFPGDLLMAEYTPWRHTAYGGYVAGAVPSKGQYFDVVRELYPWKQLVVEELKKGHIPLWNPYNFSGSPLLANYQSAVFYPLSFLYFLLPMPIAWSVLVIAQVVLSALFTYLFAKKITMSTWAAGLTAILFTFSSFASSWIEFNTVWHTWLWLPLLLYLIERFFENKYIDKVGAIAFVFGLFCAITGGHPQDFLYVFFFVVIYTACRCIPEKNQLKKTFFVGLGLLTVLPFCLAAVQLIPTIELFRSSSRVPHDPTFISEKILIQPWQMIMMVAQDFFGNPATTSYKLADTYVGKTLSISAAGLLLALIALLKRKWSWHEKFFAIAAGVLLLLTVRNPISSFIYQFPIPILSTGSPTRVLALFMLALSVLAGFGLDVLKKDTKVSRIPSLIILATLGIAISIAIAGWKFSLFPTPTAISTIIRGIVIPASAAATILGMSFLAKKRPKILLIVVTFFAVGELFYSFLKFNPFVPQAFVFPENPVFTFLQNKQDLGRFWGYGTARIEANFATPYHLFSADGTDPLNLSWYNQFLQSSVDGNIARVFTRQTRSDTAISPGYGERDLPDNAARLRVMDALGVKYMLDRVENPKDNTTWAGVRFEQLADIDEWKIFYNKLAAPRFFLADNVESYSSTEEFEKKFFDPAFDPRTTILMKNADDFFLTLKPDPNKKIDLISYEPTKVVFKTTTTTPQVLFLSDANAQGWESYSDGNLERTYTADYAFRATLVRPGTHIITFEYKPMSFTLGKWISYFSFGVGVFFFGAWFIRSKITKKETKR